MEDLTRIFEMLKEIFNQVPSDTDSQTGGEKVF